MGTVHFRLRGCVVTDDVLIPNPWDTLPAYFEDEVIDPVLLP